jgi:hypothetical protein
MEHKELTERLYKVAIYSDLIQAELTDVNCEQILNSELNSKIRNLKRSTDVFSSYINGTFKELNVSEAFGGLCDLVNEFVEKSLEQINKGDEKS